MAVYRCIQTTFWQDAFVLDLTPEEKYFYFYLLTNSKTTQCGIYELPKKIIETDTGYNRETVDKLLQRFIEYRKIEYCEDTKEIMIKNWMKHNEPNNRNVRTCILKELKNVKSTNFIEEVHKICEKQGYALLKVNKDSENDLNFSNKGLSMGLVYTRKKKEKEKEEEEKEKEKQKEKQKEKVVVVNNRSISKKLNENSKKATEKQQQKEQEQEEQEKEKKEQWQGQDKEEEEEEEEQQRQQGQRQQQQSINSNLEVTRSFSSKAIRLYKQNINGFMNQMLINSLTIAVKKYGDDMMVIAVKMAIENNALKWSYIQAILNNWDKKNIRTLDDLKREELNRAKQYKNGGGYGEESGKYSRSDTEKFLYRGTTDSESGGAVEFTINSGEVF